jgi:YegS/Rv2252/BmrU family lipid kinase
MKEKLLFIVNPVSGVWAKEHVGDLIDRYLDHQQFDYEVRFTERFGHGTALAREAVEEGFDVVVSVGGDGSINDVANGLKGTDVRLGIIAVGSGNGLAQHLGLPIRKIPKAIQVLNSGKTVAIDTVKSERRNFVSNAGAGADANVARRFRHSKVRGFFAYVWAIIRQLLFEYRAIDLEFEIDGKPFHQKTFVLGIFNAKYYGYGVGPFRQTSLRDGLLDVLYVGPVPRWKLFWLSIAILLKRTDWIKEAKRYTAKEVKILGGKKLLVQFDGDSEIISEDLEMQVESRNLKVIVPRDTETEAL